MAKVPADDRRDAKSSSAFFAESRKSSTDHQPYGLRYVGFLK